MYECVHVSKNEKKYNEKNYSVRKMEAGNTNICMYVHV